MCVCSIDKCSTTAKCFCWIDDTYELYLVILVCAISDTYIYCGECKTNHPLFKVKVTPQTNKKYNNNRTITMDAYGSSLKDVFIVFRCKLTISNIDINSAPRRVFLPEIEYFHNCCVGTTKKKQNFQLSRIDSNRFSIGLGWWHDTCFRHSNVAAVHASLAMRHQQHFRCSGAIRICD